MSWGLLPSPPPILFISAMLLACFLNPIPAWTSFLFGDHITGTKEAALALDPTIRLQRLQLSYSRSSQEPPAAGTSGHWLSHVHFLCFQRPQGRDVSGFNSDGHLKVISCFIWVLPWSLCQFIKLVLKPHPDIQEYSLISQNVRSIITILVNVFNQSFTFYPVLTLINNLCLVCACHPPERWQQMVSKVAQPLLPLPPVAISAFFCDRPMLFQRMWVIHSVPKVWCSFGVYMNWW